MTDAPTIEERYARAMRSSHLEVTEHPGDVDKLIAAGWVRDGLATTLYRLRMEFDSVKAEQQKAVENLRRRAEQARAAPAEKRPHAPNQLTRKEVLKAAEAEALTARVLILMNLKSLSRAKGELADYAIERAQRGRHLAVSDRHAEILAGQVLDVFLDPCCHHCDGRGFNGGSHRGEPQAICRPCRGSGKRRDWIARSIEQQAFVNDLFTEIDRMLGVVGGQMKRFLSQRDGIT